MLTQCKKYCFDVIVMRFVHTTFLKHLVSYYLSYTGCFYYWGGGDGFLYKLLYYLPIYWFFLKKKIWKVKNLANVCHFCALCNQAFVGRRQRAQHVLYLIWGLLTDEQLYWQWIIWSSSCYSWDHGSGDN